MRKITEFTDKDWNLDVIKSLTFKQFQDKVNGWAEPTAIKDENGKPYRETIAVLDKKKKQVLDENGVPKTVERDVVAKPTIAKPSEAELASVWKKLTGKDVKSLN